MIGALYGGVRVARRRLVSLARSRRGRSPRPSPSMSVLAAAGGLWRLGAGLAAGALYAVAPIRHGSRCTGTGSATTLALVFVPLVVLALGLMFRGRRDAADDRSPRPRRSSRSPRRTRTTAVVVARWRSRPRSLLDGVRAACHPDRRPGDPSFLRRWWRGGAVAPLLAGLWRSPSSSGSVSSCTWCGRQGASATRSTTGSSSPTGSPGTRSASICGSGTWRSPVSAFSSSSPGLDQREISALLAVGAVVLASIFWCRASSGASRSRMSTGV